jgi:uncharacterized membrane protein YheB (UPF0754 family)
MPRAPSGRVALRSGEGGGTLDYKTIGLVTIPIFSSVLGYITNWTGVWMIFQPLDFKGIRVPGLAQLVRLTPRKVQQVPGFMHGAVGWQGIIPSRAAKMGSIAVDKGVAKLGTPRQIYDQLEPERITEHILDHAQRDIEGAVDRIIEREHPQFWRDLPPRAREAINSRVQQQLPDVVESITEDLRRNLDQLLDIKMMVIRHIEENPEIANRIFYEIGKKELRFIIRFGAVFGFIAGIPLAVATGLLHSWAVLLFGSAAIGYVTNWLGIWMIFEPTKPRKIGPWTWKGLFLRRQEEVAKIYARLIAEDVVNVRNIGDELVRGPNSDRTRKLIEDAMRPAVDRAVGPLQPAMRVAVGAEEYDAVRESLASEAVGYTTKPLQDTDFNREQSEQIRTLAAERISELPPDEFSDMLRTVIRQDEWLLIAHGGALGLVSGGLHLLLFPV